MPATPETPPAARAPAVARTFGTAALGLAVINLLFLGSFFLAASNPIDRIVRTLGDSRRFASEIWGHRANPALLYAGPYNSRVGQTWAPYRRIALWLAAENTFSVVILGSIALVGLGVRRVGPGLRLWRCARIHATAGLVVVAAFALIEIHDRWRVAATFDGSTLVFFLSDLGSSLLAIPSDWLLGLTRYSTGELCLYVLWLPLFTGQFLLCTRVLRRLRSAEVKEDSAPA